MALIDYRILQQAPGSMVGAVRDGYNQGMQASDADRQRRLQIEQQKLAEQERIRQQSFQQNLNGLLGSYGEYAHTPEGQRGLFADMSKAGFGREMMGLMGGLPQQAKPAADEWKPLPGAEAPTLYRGGSGEIKATGVAGKPAKAATPRAPVFKPGDDGFQHEWDPVARKFVRTNLKAPKDAPKPEKTLGEKDVFGMEQQLRTQYLGQTKDFRDVRDAFGRIKVSAKDPSAAGDLALIFNYMKMLDPGSTVRESEFATAAASGSLGDRFVAAGKKLLSGERLDPTQRADFLNRANSLYAQQQRQMEKAKFETRKMAASYSGLNPDRILMDAELADEQAATPATPTFEQYDSLPPGTEFTDPDGNVRRKP